VMHGGEALPSTRFAQLRPAPFQPCRGVCALMCHPLILLMLHKCAHGRAGSNDRGIRMVRLSLDGVVCISSSLFIFVPILALILRALEAHQQFLLAPTPIASIAKQAARIGPAAACVLLHSATRGLSHWQWTSPSKSKPLAVEFQGFVRAQVFLKTHEAPPSLL